MRSIKINGLFIVTIFLAFFIVKDGCSFENTAIEIKKVAIENPDIDKYEFTNAFISSMGFVSSAIQRITILDKKQYASEVESQTDYMTTLKLTSSDYEMAADTIAPFKLSKNQLIKDTATALEKLYSSHVSLNEQMIDAMVDLNDPMYVNSPETFHVGVHMKRQSELSAKHIEFMKGLMYSALMISQILASEKSYEVGKRSILGITRSQKESLISSLISTFGEEVKAGFNKDIENPNYFDSSGGLLYQVIALNGHKCLDD